MQNRIREIRKTLGLTMKELGAKIGVAESTISKYETGKRQPDNETLLKLGEALDVYVGYLLGVEPKEGDRIVSMDDFTYALQNEAKTLTEMDKQILLSMAKQLNDARMKKNEGAD